MRTFRTLVLSGFVALACQGAIAADPGYSRLPPEMLLQFEGQLPPMQDLVNSGLVPAQGVDTKSTISEMGYITQWLNHYYMMTGTLDADLVGEDDVAPICYGDPLTANEMAPSMNRNYWTYPEIWTYHWNAYNDSEACERLYTDQVRYFLTEVKSPTAQTARLFAGADDGIKVWLNGVEVMRHENGVYEAGQYQAPVQLQAGWNLVLVKVYYPLIGPSDHPDYEHKRWSLRFADTAGTTPLLLTQSTDGRCDHERSSQWVYAGGAADLPGALGSQWASDLRLTNPYGYPLELTVEYYEEGGVNAAPAKKAPVDPVATSSTAVAPDATQMIVLDPYETRTYRRVLTSLLGVTPPQKGMLAIRGYYYWDAQSYGTVELKTYNQSGGGSFGTVIPVTNLNGGYTCCSQVLHGLRNGPGFRTNIGMAPRRILDSELEFTVTIWDSVTGTFAQKDFVGRKSFQINDIFARLGLGNIETDTAMAYVSWNSNGTGARFRFFASVVDNHTSDPVDVSPGYWYQPPPLQ